MGLKEQRLTGWKKVQNFLLKWFLPIGFFFAIVIGLAWPMPGLELSTCRDCIYGGFKLFQTFNVMTIFVISGLTLKTGDILGAFNAKGGASFAYGMIMIIGITPLIAFLAVEIPFQQEEFRYGMAVFIVGPTTIASGSALVAQAYGNNVLALLLTVMTNLIAVVTIPLWLKAVISGANASIDAVELLIKLLITVLLPLIIGQVLRAVIPGIKGWVNEQKTFLKLAGNFSLVLVVWQTMSRSADEIYSVSAEALITIIVSGGVLHAVYLAINYILCVYVFKFETPDMKALVIMASEKTLPVAIAVISFLGDLGDEGFLAIPPIVSQQIQLFMDAYIAGKWETEVEKDLGYVCCFVLSFIFRE
mmetsp:Transcript_7991/g.12122  ORF Transcript_7991/g.12122 Transcript_7991/m.12122 type:complete len:361 (-) Transcript_7991:240-1322(-)